MAPVASDIDKQTESIATGLRVLAKPIGPVCDMVCEYCFCVVPLAAWRDRMEMFPGVAGEAR